MNTHSQKIQKILELDEEAPRILDRFEARLIKLRQQGLLLWTGILRDVSKESKEARAQRDAEIYEQLQLAELEADNPEAVKQRIGLIKGMLTMLCLGFITLGSISPSDDFALRRVRSGVRVIRSISRKGAEA